MLRTIDRLTQFLFALLLAAPLFLSPSPSLADNNVVDAGGSNIGTRTEDPGPFLQWPLERVDISAILRLPDSPWTHEFLGIYDCPPYPALLDAHYWPYNVPGNYPSSRKDYVKPDTSDDRARWQNRDSTDGDFENAIACYSAHATASGIPDHAGTDIAEANGEAVLAAAAADEVNVYSFTDSDGIVEYRVRLRHPNVNGSGMTWYTYYLHMQSAEWGVGTHQVAVGVYQKIGAVGRNHLHFQTAIGPNYDNSEARNPWGIDSSPWGGCLWLDQSLCQQMPSQVLESPEMTAPSTGHFTDVDLTRQTYPYIEALYRIGAVQGTGGGSTRLFKPEDYTERDQAAKMIDLGLLRKPNYQDNQPAFNDVSPSHPFYQYIRDLKELGIVKGYQGGTYFNDPTKSPPDNTRLTRCQAATLIVRARGEDPNYTDDRQHYSDVPPSHACYNAIERLFEIGASPYTTSRFRPDYPVTRELMAYIVVRGLPELPEQITTFVDVNFDHSYFSYIEAIYERGITRGCDSSLQPPYLQYCPNDLLKREQAAAFISRALGFTPFYTDGRQSFPDVPPSNVFYHNIEHLYELGVVQGYSDGRFKPDDVVTRRQFAQMIQRGLAVANIACPTTHTAAFNDVPPGSDGYDAIQCLKDLGISSGYSTGEFRPDANIDRGQAAKLMDLGFIHKVINVPQELAEAVNDSPDTAPVEEPLPPPAEAYPDTEGAPVGIPLVTTNTPGDQDADLVKMDLEPGKEYNLVATEMGPNAKITAEMSPLGSLQNAENDLIFSAAFDASNMQAATFTVAAGGTYLLRFTNKQPFATEGAAYRIAVREKAAAPPPPPPAAYSLYLPAIQKN